MTTGTDVHPWGERRVSTALILAVLEALRAQDTPTDIHPDENPHPHMPHRLGMSDVILDQIRRYRRLGFRGRVAPGEAEDLIRLISRRPDAAAVFETAGQALAERAFARRSSTLRLVLRVLPRDLRLRAALRHLRTHSESLLATTRTHLTKRPTALHAQGVLSARAGSGAACYFYAAFLEETLRAFTGRPWLSRHEVCEAAGHARCVWAAEETPASPTVSSSG